MKNTVLLMTLAILGVLTLMIVSTIQGRMGRAMELESNLSSVVETAVERMACASFSDGQDIDVLMETFVKDLSDALDLPSDISIDVWQYDPQKGILSVRVTLSYVHPNLDQGRIVCEKHVIRNQLEEEEHSREITDEKN